MAAEAMPNRQTIALRRLLRRTFWFALPAFVVVAGLVALGWLSPERSALAALAAAILGGVVAWLHERRLQATSHYLSVIAEGREPGSPPQFDLLGDDALAAILPRLDRALARQRAHQTEVDRLLAAVIDSFPDPVLLVTDHRVVVQANPPARRLLGETIITKPLEMTLRDPGVLAAVDEALAGEGNAQATFQLAGPTLRAFDVSVVPVQHEERRAALVSFRELTEQLMIERMRSDFVANVSHELRTPLSVLRGFIETLSGAARDDAEARERFLETMGVEADRMARLIDDLLSLSRIELNEHLPPDEEVQIGECLDGVLRALEGYAAQHDVRFDIHQAAALPTIAGDPDQIVQLMTNLIDNAIKYGGDGHRVSIAVEHLDPAPPGAGPLTGQSALRIVVTDEGPGIPREHLPRLTERFFRVDSARSRQLGGTGLGLAIVKHILRRHRGHLAIESEVGRGTSVKVYLPA